MFLVGTGLLVQRNVYFFLHHSQRHSENKPKGLKVLKQADQLNSHNIVDCCSKPIFNLSWLLISLLIVNLKFKVDLSWLWEKERM